VARTVDHPEPKQKAVPGLHPVLESLPDPARSNRTQCGPGSDTGPRPLAGLACPPKTGIGTAIALGRRLQTMLAARGVWRSSSTPIVSSRRFVAIQPTTRSPRSPRDLTSLASLAFWGNWPTPNLARPAGGAESGFACFFDALRAGRRRNSFQGQALTTRREPRGLARFPIPY